MPEGGGSAAVPGDVTQQRGCCELCNTGHSSAEQGLPRALNHRCCGGRLSTQSNDHLYLELVEPRICSA